MIDKKIKKTSSCSSDVPSEYFSKDSIFKKIVFEEKYIGLNFEFPCNEYNLEIYELNKQEVFNMYLTDYATLKSKNKKFLFGKIYDDDRFEQLEYAFS